MKNINNLIKNKKSLNFCDIILMHCFKRFTYKIYRLGIKDCFYWDNKVQGCNKAVTPNNKK